MSIGNVTMNFCYREAFGEPRVALRTLLNDCVRGDATLFDRGDSVEAAWALWIPFSTSGVPPRAPTVPQYPAEVGAKRIRSSARA